MSIGREVDEGRKLRRLQMENGETKRKEANTKNKGKK